MYIVLDIQLYMNECFYFFFRKEGKRILQLSCNDDFFLFNYLADFSYFLKNFSQKVVLPWKFLLLHNVFIRYIGLNKTHVFVRYIGLNKTQENRFIINIIQSCYVVLDREK